MEILSRLTRATHLHHKKEKTQSSQVIHILSALGELEKSDKLAVVDEKDKSGIVLSYELVCFFNRCYVTRAQHYMRKYDVRTFFEKRHRSQRFSKKYNPDEELLALCRNARMLVNFRRMSKHVTPNGQDTDYTSLMMADDEPLYITMMNKDLEQPISIGYEAGGVITLQKYKAK